MSYCISCHDCGETVYPPVEATGHGGKSEIAALRLALEHVKETGHQEIHVIAGCYYTGDGERPTAFGEGTTDPESVAKPDKATLVDAVGAAARRLREAADDVEERIGEDEFPPVSADPRNLRNYADAIESNATPGSYDYPTGPTVRPAATTICSSFDRVIWTRFPNPITDRIPMLNQEDKKSSRTRTVYAIGTVATIWLGGVVAVLPLAVVFATPEPSPWILLWTVVQWPRLFPLYQAVGLAGGLSALALVTAIALCSAVNVTHADREENDEP